MTKFQEYARKNFTPMSAIDEMWHPEIQAECRVMNDEESARREAALQEAEAKKASERQRIEDVILKTADISAELAGRIIVRISFAGSHAKTKRLTPQERAIVMNLPADVKASIGGEKPLFQSKAYDDLMGYINAQREAFAAFGIPHINIQASHVVDVTRIPDIEDLAVATENGLSEKVDAFIADWSRAIEEAKGSLGQLFNENDYKKPEVLRTLFRFAYNWMAFGVPEELKQFDARIYAKAMEKAAKAWKEIEANGILLLRTTIMDLVSNLADALTPKDDGTKKRFYATSVTKIDDFIASFSTRNICKDGALDAEVAKLKAIVSGIDLRNMSSDETMRAAVRARMEEAKSTLSDLVIDASARVITFEE